MARYESFDKTEIFQTNFFSYKGQRNRKKGIKVDFSDYLYSLGCSQIVYSFRQKKSLSYRIYIYDGKLRADS